MATAPRSAPRVAVLADSALDGDSRAHRVAAAAVAAGYEVTLIGRAAEGPAGATCTAPAGVRLLRVTVAETLHRRRLQRPVRARGTSSPTAAPMRTPSATRCSPPTRPCWPPAAPSWT
ncbi:hypothetical protein [Actinacidiphila glaucinigra]|uniref:hypothetical protein n=1 Tax=Actinacidiphila glaucinigra TaxID=235986 RepID=UPI003D9487FF